MSYATFHFSRMDFTANHKLQSTVNSLVISDPSVLEPWGEKHVVLADRYRTFTDWLQTHTY